MNEQVSHLGGTKQVEAPGFSPVTERNGMCFVGFSPGPRPPRLKPHSRGPRFTGLKPGASTLAVNR
jgi:hypothetical protein